MALLRDAYQIVAGSGLHVAVATAEATQAVTLNKVYIISVNTDTYIRFSGTAVSAADGGFDLFMPSGTTAVLRATNATFRAIRDSADGDCGLSEVAIA